MHGVHGLEAQGAVVRTSILGAMVWVLQVYTVQGGEHSVNKLAEEGGSSAEMEYSRPGS